jgi:hypothetical protein
MCHGAGCLEKYNGMSFIIGLRKIITIYKSKSNLKGKKLFDSNAQ